MTDDDDLDYCEGCERAVSPVSMAWLTPTLYRCTDCRGLPAMREIAGRELAAAVAVGEPEYATEVPMVRDILAQQYRTQLFVEAGGCGWADPGGYPCTRTDPHTH